MNLIYTKEIRVAEEHLDRNQHVNNVQYVHWVEEVAEEHWDLLKSHTPYGEDVWVLVDHHIQYRKEVFLDDVLVVKTYPQPPQGIRHPRRVDFYCKEELVVTSETRWILIDATTKRAKRVKANWLEDLE